jgi:hypothetical protein
MVTERLDKISALFGGKHRVYFFVPFFLVLLVADIFLPSLVFVFCTAAEKVGLPLGLVGPGISSANSSCVVVDVCRVVAEEAVGDAS